MSKTGKQQNLPISDIAEPLVSVTDVKHYVYCPRLVYFDRVLHAQPVLALSKRKAKNYIWNMCVKN